MRSDPASLAFHDSLLEAETAFKGIRLATPVMYDPSEYPKSDAFQVVSEVGTRVAMSPSAVVLLVSGTDTVPILETAHINRSLRRRRWFARDVIGVEGSLRRSAKASKFAQVAALTTVTFLADNDTPRDADLRSQFFESYVEPDTPSLSVFRSALAYESLMLLHRAFTSSQYHGYSDILDAFHTEGPFSRKLPRYTEMGERVGPRLRELASRGWRKPGAGFTQPRAHSFAQPCTVLSGYSDTI